MHRLKATLIAATFFMGIVACKKNSNADLESSNAVLSAWIFAPAVKKINLQVGNQHGICTGNLISERIVLTAGHCLIDENVRTKVTIEGLAPITTLIYPDWENSQTPDLRKHPETELWDHSRTPYLHDLTLLAFDQPIPNQNAKVEPGEIVTISELVPKPGDETFVVGYGTLDNAGVGALSDPFFPTCGTNNILGQASDARNNGMWRVRGEARPVGDFPGTNTQSAPGDSGGPLFVNGELVGTVSWGKEVDRHVDETKYVNLFDLENRRFIDRFRFLGIGTKAGAKNEVFVDTLIPGGPAAKAGIMSQDIITRFTTDTKAPLQAFQDAEFDAALRSGDSITLEVHRGVETRVFTAKLDKTSTSETSRARSRHDNNSIHCPPNYLAGVIDKYGFTVQSAITSRFPKDFIFIVTSVEKKSPAQTNGLRTGDVISTLNDQMIGTVFDFRKKMEALSSSDVKLHLIHRGERREEVLLSNGRIEYVTPDYNPRFGALARQCQARGLCIDKIFPNSVASKAGLKVGDRLWQFNGVVLNSIKNYEEAVDSAPDEQDIHIIVDGNSRTSPEDVVIGIRLPRYINPKATNGKIRLVPSSSPSPAEGRPIPAPPVDDGPRDIILRLNAPSTSAVENQEAIR